MGIPKNVRLAASRAEALHAKAYSPNKEEEEPKQSAMQDAMEKAQQETAEEKPVEKAPEPPPEPLAKEPKPEQDSDELSALKAKLEESDQRWKTLQGMMNAESRRAKEAQEEAGRLQNLLATLGKEKEEIPSGVRPEDVEAYGQEMIDVVRRAAAEESRKQAQQYQNEIHKLQKQLSNVTGQVVQQSVNSVEQFLDANIANWRAINEDPKFIEWLSYPDVFTGQTRQQLLDSAAQEMNAQRVAVFFQAFAKEMQHQPAQQQGSPEPEPQAPQQVAPQQVQRRTPRVNMADLVAPGQQPATSGAVKDDGEQSFFSQAQIAKFYDDVRRGKYANDPKEKTRIERQIMKAASEGRIAM